MSGPSSPDPAQAFRTHATRVLHTTHRLHLWLGFAVISLVGLVGGPAAGARSDASPTAASLGLSALQRGIAVGWLAGALNVSLLVWMGRRLLQRGAKASSGGPASAGTAAGDAGSAAGDAASAGAAVAVASGKLVVLGLVLWSGWHWWEADPAGLVLGVTLAPIALAVVGWQLLRSQSDS